MELDIIKEKIEELSEAVVLSDAADMRGMKEIHDGLRIIASTAAAASLDPIQREAEEAAREVEKVIFDDAEMVSDRIQAVGESLSKLQVLIREAEVQPATAVSEEPEAVTPAGTGDSAGAAYPKLPENVDMDIFIDFLSRQESVLEEMESLILGHEQNRDEDSLVSLKRLIHTMKGESGLLGLEEVQKICHTTETLLEEPPRDNMVDVLLAVKDWLGRAFLSYEGKGQAPGPVDVLMELLLETNWTAPAAPAAAEEAPAAGDHPDTEPVAAAEPQPAEEQAVPEAPPAALPEELPPGPMLQESDSELLNDFINEATEHLDAVEEHMLTLENNPEDDVSLNAVFRAFHTIKGVAGYLSLEQIGLLAHEVETMLDNARKGLLKLEGAAVDVIFESVDMMKTLVRHVRDALVNQVPLRQESGVPLLLERIRAVVQGRPLPAPAKAAPAAPVVQKPVQESVQVPEMEPEQIPVVEENRTVAPLPVSEPVLPAEPAAEPESAPEEVETASRAAVHHDHIVKVREFIKVDADRLDRLIDTIGELVITESMVSQMMRESQVSSTMLGNVGQLDKITRQLQEMSTSLRMIQVRSTFQKMARLVRDLAKKSGKKIDFIMSGEDTELDKSVVDKIGDPLVHMIRNAVDHGIETAPEDRVRNGKPETAKVYLRAYHKGGSIHIEVEDDGRGLDKEAILRKAMENGVITDPAGLSESDIFSLIFQPGFSTAKQVTDVSGRGIGMDVVRRNIEALRGNIDIQSEPGRGSVFTIRLPLTLAIIDGMLVGVGDEKYIIPTLSIVRSLRPGEEMVSTLKEKGEMLSLDGQLIPLFHLSELFNIEGAKEKFEDSLVVVVENAGLFTALVVDELFGQQQIVIKTLGKYLQGIPGISGSSIMSDGRVALILDVAGLVKLANKDKFSGQV